MRLLRQSLLHYSLLGSMTLLGVASPLAAQNPDLLLTDVSRTVGLHWLQVDGVTKMGAGGGFLDFDGDGWLDILLSGGTSVPALYRSTRGGSSFQLVTPSPFADPLGAEYMCTTVGDIDNDGDPDVFFGKFGFNLLYRNDGQGRFTDVTTPAIAGGRYTFTTTAAFGDFDADGNLDLYVGNYITPGGPAPRHIPTPNLMFRGHGDATFTDATTPLLAGAGTALATTWSDFDADGDVDLMLANDFGMYVEPNQIYRNDGPGPSGFAFTECSAAVGADLGIYCMGIAIGDYDRDGDFDYYFTNLGRNAFLRNDGVRFTDIATQTGTELTHDPATNPQLLATSWGCGFHDLDSDGWLDLYVSNGHIPSGPSIANGTHTRNALFRHDGSALTYSLVSAPLDDGVGRGVAFGDYDNDGDVDVLQCNVNGIAHLLRNDSPRRGRWASARLRGRVSNRDALGARVDLDVGGFTAAREVSRNSSYQSSSDARLHFGLGAATRIRRAHVHWPSGIEQDLHDLPVARAMSLVEPMVTIENELSQSIVTPFGRVLWFQAELVNHGPQATPVVYAPHLRAGYAAAPSFGAPGTTLWSGTYRATSVAAGQRQPIGEFLIVPTGVTLPVPSSNLDFVWIVGDAAFALDEAKLPVR